MSKAKNIDKFQQDFYDEYGFYPPEDWDEDSYTEYEDMIDDLDGLDNNDLY